MSEPWPPGAAWVVIPTYNEAENITAILRAVAASLDAAGLEWRVLVVDDGSPDGTPDLVDAVAADEPRIAVMRRTVKEGLWPAYRAAFRHALAAGAALVVQMDADFSHDPKDVPRLIDAARDADLVLGSRYTPGGGVARWGLWRRTMSRGGSLYARMLLGIPLRDATSGFKCYRRVVLETLPLDEITSSGYVFSVEIHYRALLAGFRVVEIPIVFTDRVLGTSKMTPAIVREAARQVPKLRRLKRTA